MFRLVRGQLKITSGGHHYMRNNTNKSIKLNRQLDKLLVEAMKKDLLVKIGWGREQDKKPRDGEIGAITLLPDKSKVLLLGNL